MQLNDILSQVGGIQSRARTLGVSESQAASGAAAPSTAMLDLNGDGNPLDDILGMAGKRTR